jgi:hypothetical protein
MDRDEEAHSHGSPEKTALQVANDHHLKHPSLTSCEGDNPLLLPIHTCKFWNFLVRASRPGMLSGAIFMM